METHRLALPAGFRIENYEIVRMLGKGGFGITYQARDVQIGRLVAIKELLPDSIATRLAGSTVVPQSAAHEESWQWARERFVDEARVLAGFRHPNIIAVHRIVEANGTVYLIMDCIEGESYEARLRRIGREPDEPSLRRVIEPLLDGLQEVHAAGLLHRDIKPENILFDKRGNPVLIDFGAARSSVGATMAMTSIVTHGYSPAEQYQTKGKMGPWTDIYALGAVMCRAISGEKPPVASDRIMEDDFQWLSYREIGGFSTTFVQSVDWALRVRPSDRPESIQAWASCFGSGEIKQDVGTTRPSPSDTENPVIAVEGTTPPASAPSDSNIAQKDASFVNSLGMKFVPVPGTDVLFSIWDTRVRDFASFVEALGHYSGLTGRMFGLLKPLWQNLGFPQTEDHPVVNVSWDDAKAFCKWLTSKERGEGKIGEDREYRLPTDAEWSVAVGLASEIGKTPQEKDGKMRRVYPWGTQWPPPKSAGNYASSLRVDSFANTSPVGSFPPNQFGLYDMGGNVWQWCEDRYSDSGAARVVRGASWWSVDPKYLLASARDFDLPDLRNTSFGFRCVLADH
jgi:serine/threonine protein kinase